MNNRIPEGMSVRIYGVGTGIVSGPENRMVRRIGYSHITGCRHKLSAAEYQSNQNNPGALFITPDLCSCHGVPFCIGLL